MGKRPTIVTWTEPWYCYAIKTNRRRIRPQNQPRNGALVACKCKLTTAPHQYREPGSCAVSFLPAVIARIKSNNRNWAAGFMFSTKSLVLRSNFHGCKCPFCSPADAHGQDEKPMPCHPALVLSLRGNFFQVTWHTLFQRR